MKINVYSNKQNIILMKKKFILFLFIIVGFVSLSSAQIYSGDLTKERYYKIISGNSFYPAKVLMHTGEVYEGFVARFPESTILRYKETMDSKGVQVLSDRHVKSFKYGLEEYSYPTFVFKDLDPRNNKIKMRAVEIVSQGDITIYVYTWPKKPDALSMYYGESDYKLNLQFYLEKNGEIKRINNFSKQLRYLIEDKEEPLNEYKKNYRKKYKRTDDYIEFINLINLYNETE